MAEYVHQNLEEMLPELEEMLNLGIFSRDEVREIMKRRTDFEYKLQRRIVQKPDFLKYIQYELNLHTLRKKRKQRLRIKKKTTEGELKAIGRIHFIYQKALKKFGDDDKLWMQYLALCRQLGSNQATSKAIPRMLQLHPYNSGLWIVAAKHEFEESKNISAARTLLQKALRLNPTCQLIWVEYYRMELLHVDKVQKRRKVIGLAGMDLQNEDPVTKEFLSYQIPRIVYKKACEAVPDDVEFRLKLLSVCQLFEDTKKCQEEIYSSLLRDFPTAEEIRDVLAHRVLQEMSTTDNVVMTDIVWKLGEEERDKVYEQAVQEIPTMRMWEFYMKASLENLEKSTPEQAERRVGKALYVCGRAQKERLLSQEMYIAWINILLMSYQVERAQQVCRQAVKVYPQSVSVWVQLLKCHMVHSGKKEGTSDMEELFTQGAKAVHPPDSLPLWLLWIDWSLNQRPHTTEEVFKKSVGCCPAVAEVMKERYLDWAAMSLDVKKVRKIYKRLLPTQPVTLNFHKKCIQLEQSQVNVNTKRVRSLYETAVEEFGRFNLDVWIDYIKMESSESEGDSSNVSKIHWRAMKCLDGSLTADFLSKYSLLQSGHL